MIVRIFCLDGTNHPFFCCHRIFFIKGENQIKDNSLRLFIDIEAMQLQEVLFLFGNILSF